MPDGLIVSASDSAPPVEPAATADPRGSPATAHAPPLPASTPPGAPNPMLTLDPALGLVVLQFRDGAGGATTSIPTQQQLDAYRSGSASPPGRHGADRTPV